MAFLFFSRLEFRKKKKMEAPKKGRDIGGLKGKKEKINLGI